MPTDPPISQSAADGETDRWTTVRIPVDGPSQTHGALCCNEAWESAYARFETPDEEVRKFRRRLISLGVQGWRKDAAVVDLFCGRGGGLHALAQLGFSRIEGVDLSPSLLARYSGPAVCHLGDCRDLPLESGSRDVLIVQGGLHHLQLLPTDLDRVLVEVRRVLKNGGRFVVVEPWLTPFLRLVHMLCASTIVRRLWSRVDALAVMIENERITYDQWLQQPSLILERLGQTFVTERQSAGWGKFNWVGLKRS